MHDAISSNFTLISRKFTEKKPFKENFWLIYYFFHSFSLILRAY